MYHDPKMPPRKYIRPSTNYANILNYPSKRKATLVKIRTTTPQRMRNLAS
jgi:hypothetical protein